MNNTNPTLPQGKFLVSACLIGCNCRYDGKNQSRPELVAAFEQGRALPVCPEELAGLGTPREPCEQKGSRIISRSGVDQTESFRRGAEKALQIALQAKVTMAFLKSKSPMCGHGRVYDGSFTGRLIEGHGQFTKYLLDHGIALAEID